MSEKIKEFLDSKKITDEFIRNIVSGFISMHTELYGDVIPFESLMERLNTNLNSINLIYPSKQIMNANTKNMVACYEGFDKNSISMFFTQEDLKSLQLREYFIAILVHELIHCAYTIKQNDLYETEKQIFGTYMKLLDGSNQLIDGNYIYMEAIVNYISVLIFGTNIGMYLAQTNNIAKLMAILDEKELIRSAFNSDEQAFKKCFEVLSDGAYEYFTEGMKWLSYNGNFGFRRGTEIMNNFFNGKIPSLAENQRKIEELNSLKSSLLQDEQLEQGYTRTLKRRGFINMFLLVLIFFVIIVVFAIITLMII